MMMERLQFGMWVEVDCFINLKGNILIVVLGLHLVLLITCWWDLWERIEKWYSMTFSNQRKLLRIWIFQNLVVVSALITMGSLLLLEQLREVYLHLIFETLNSLWSILKVIIKVQFQTLCLVINEIKLNTPKRKVSDQNKVQKVVFQVKERVLEMNL